MVAFPKPSLKTPPAGGKPSFADRLRALMRVFTGPQSQEAALRESLDEAIEEVISEVIEDRKSKEEDFRAEERMMIQNIIRFGGIRVEDVMVPRADIVAVELSTPIDQLVRIFFDAAHSRMPVYRENLDDPVGIVHVKDVIGVLIEQQENGDDSNGDTTPIARIKREVLFVPPSMSIADLLIKMQASRMHMALVIDEYGGTDGLVTIEDLVEQIVGEIEDEHDIDQSPALVPSGRGVFEADARVPIEELEEKIGRSLSDDEKEEDIDTLGGLVFSLLGRIPQRGELIPHPGNVDFEVTDADPRRIKKLRIRVRGALKQDGEPADSASAQTESKSATQSATQSTTKSTSKSAGAA